MQHLLLLSLSLSLLAVPLDAFARAKGLKATPAPSRVTLDGVPQEWDGELRALSYTLSGAEPAGSDAGAEAMIAYDDEALYVVAEVSDDELVGGRDQLSLLLGIPGGTLHQVALYPGVPGRSRAQVKVRGVPVRGAKIVEAPRDGGYSLEAQIPWSSIPKSDTVRIGYRGAILLHDVDGGSTEKVLSTSDRRDYDALPPISMPAELALGGGLLRERNITTPPAKNLLADVVGDRMLERVLVYDRFVVVLGPHYRDGEQYYFRDLGSDADEGDLLELEVRDLTGDGKDDFFVRRRVRGSAGEVEVVEILSYHGGGETPEAVFAQEVALDLKGDGRVDNELKIVGRGSRTRIMLSAGREEGIDKARFERVSSSGATPVLVPWGGVASQVFGLRDGHFTMIHERAQTPEPVAATPAPMARPRAPARRNKRAAPASRAGTAPNLDPVYALYKKRARVSGAPRWDLQADLAEDDERERFVVHDRDMVVFGEGFRSGRGFAAMTLSHFESAGDLTKVKTRDVTGDGKAEILVWGIVRAKLPADLGGGEMRREVVMVYKLRGGQFERIFAAEVGRRVGKKRVVARLSFPKQRIELKPGRAIGYGERSYPWRQRTEPDGIFEPLLLPWGGVDRIRLRYDGSTFVRE